MISPAYSLRPFDPLFASTVAAWVRSEEELFWLAPRTAYPLTAAKVVAWTEGHGRAMLLFAGTEPRPCGYGELNPMPTTPGHLWLGHLIVSPQYRRMGIGRQLTDALVHDAFANGGARKVSLVVFPENVAAIRCYLRCGFRYTGEEHQRFNGQGPRFKLLRFEMRAPNGSVTESVVVGTVFNRGVSRAPLPQRGSIA